MRLVFRRGTAFTLTVNNKRYQLFPDTRVHGQHLVLGRQLLVDPGGSMGRICRPVLLPGLPIAPVREHRLIKRILVSFPRMLGAKVVTTQSNFAHGVQPKL